jgi:hypothetical protein
VAIFRVPFLQDAEITREAERFCAGHNFSEVLPVPIEAIVEFRLGISIVPLPGFYERYHTTGALSADMTEIAVGDLVLKRSPARYRFTLAHEA